MYTYMHMRVIYFLFFYISTQGKREEGFEFVTSASLGIVHNRLSYPLGTPTNSLVQLCWCFSHTRVLLYTLKHCVIVWSVFKVNKYHQGLLTYINLISQTKKIKKIPKEKFYPTLHKQKMDESIVLFKINCYHIGY